MTALLERDVATLTLDAPERANALTPEVVGELRREIARAAEHDVAALVLQARGRSFCAGVGLADRAVVDDRTLGARFVALEQLLAELAHAPMLTVACVQGPAVGAGADLAVACDYRIGTAAASFRFPGPRFGVVLGAHRLARVVGANAACRLLVEQDLAAAPDARRIGLLTHLVEPDSLTTTAVQLAAAASMLDRRTLRAILAVTRQDDRAAAMTALRESVGIPGLADRLRRHVEEERGTVPPRKEHRQ